MASIVVVGAGVSGLTTAIELKRANSDYDITIVASYIPGDIHPDYTSPFAGANWHSFATNDDKDLQKYDTYGYKRLIELAENEPRSGIWIKSNHEYKLEGSAPSDPEPWYKDVVDDYRVIPQDELPEGISQGSLFKGLVISVPIYLNFLYAQATELGISIKRVSAIKDISQARNYHSNGKKADLVINCTGLLANRMSGYKDLKRNYPILGQVLLVRNNCPKMTSVSGFKGVGTEMLYVFPRKEGGCIIGGCFKENFTTTEATEEDKELTERIKQRALEHVPELIDEAYEHNPPFLDIVHVGVGQRPFRDGGARIERDEDHNWLIHNYGFGGGGYQGSYGFSAEVVKLAAKALENSKSKL